MKKTVLCIAALAALVLTPGLAFAQDAPNEPMKIEPVNPDKPVSGATGVEQETVILPVEEPPKEADPAAGVDDQAKTVLPSEELASLKLDMFSDKPDVRYKALTRLIEMGKAAEDVLKELSSYKPGEFELTFMMRDAAFSLETKGSLKIQIKATANSTEPFWMPQNLYSKGISGSFLPFGKGDDTLWIVDTMFTKELRKVYNGIDPLYMIKELRLVRPGDEITVSEKIFDNNELKPGKLFYQYYGFAPEVPSEFVFGGKDASLTVNCWSGSFKVQGSMYIIPEISDSPASVWECKIGVELDPILPTEEYKTDDVIDLKITVKNESGTAKLIPGLKDQYETTRKKLGWWYLVLDADSKVVMHEDIVFDPKFFDDYRGDDFELQKDEEKVLKVIVNPGYTVAGEYTLIIGFNSPEGAVIGNAIKLKAVE